LEKTVKSKKKEEKVTNHAQKKLAGAEQELIKHARELVKKN